MKKWITSCLGFLLSLGVAQSVCAQGYGAHGSLGLGNVTGFNHPQGKISLNIMCVREILNQRAQMGVEIGMGGNFIPGDNGTDDITMVEVIDATHANWTSIMFKGRYFFADGSLKPFASVALGANNYWFNVNTVEAETTNKWNLGLVSEIGLSINRFSMGLRYMVGGATPNFSGTRPAEYGGNPVVLTSENLNVFLLTAGYTFYF
ncbi:MAG: hypothetical protein AAGC88_11130 [Bacteroidota bacterium]